MPEQRDPAAVHSVILDTDIGTDVDDSYALAVLLGSPEVSILGITTVYGDTLLRARLTRRLLSLVDVDLPVIPGCQSPLSGADVWLSGEEGRGYSRLEDEVVVTDTSASEFLIDRVLERPGEIDVIAIGPLTNIATAIQSSPDFEKSVRRLWIMGGRFDESVEREHNFRSDAVAADVVFRSEIPTTCCGVEVTRTVKLWEGELREIGESGPLGEAIERDTRWWMARWNEPFEVPHDAVVALSLLRPDFFEYQPVRISVQTQQPMEGASRATPQADSRSVVARRADADGVVGEIVSRVRASHTAGRREMLH